MKSLIAAIYCRKSHEQAVADDAKSVTRQIVRAQFSEDDLLRSQRTAEIGTAREIAAAMEGCRNGEGRVRRSQPNRAIRSS